MKKLDYLITALLCVSTLLLLSLCACSNDEGNSVDNNDVLSDFGVNFNDEEKPDSLLSDSIRAAYNMIYGQWKEFYYMDGLDGHNGESITNGPILTVKKDKSFSFSSNPDLIRKFKIAKIYKLKEDTLYTLVCHRGFDGSYRGCDFYRYDIEGNTLYVEEEFFGTDFQVKTWRFKSVKMP